MSLTTQVFQRRSIKHQTSDSMTVLIASSVVAWIGGPKFPFGATLRSAGTSIWRVEASHWAVLFPATQPGERLAESSGGRSGGPVLYSPYCLEGTLSQVRSSLNFVTVAVRLREPVVL
jgi:hypothetical protein